MPILLLVNDERTQRVAELLADFTNLQHYIAAAPTNCTHPDDYYTEGWAALRQCALDGQHILDVAADTHVPRGRTADEQNKAELQQYVDLNQIILVLLARFFIITIFAKYVVPGFI